VTVIDDAPLTADEILTFGPVVEAAVWTPMWLAEKRAPIAVQAGRPKLGPVFNEQGVGKAVLIRPCVSRGKRVRGLPPIYTPTMLEGAAQVFAGWPMYLDHVPAELAEVAAKRGRSVKELGGQVLTPYWQTGFVQEADDEFGYQPGGILAEVWATPFTRNLVGENPNLLHTSIAAWPTSGKPGPAPWNAKIKGMVIEGIRRQPQGSVDYVPRGGAGGRILPAAGVQEGEDADSRAWPEPTWEADDVRLVVSLAEGAYAPDAMANGTTPDFSKMDAAALRAWLNENAPNLLPALREDAQPPANAQATGGLTEADVRRIFVEAQGTSKPATADDVRELAEELMEERETQRSLSALAHSLIEAAEGLTPSWKADLKARYSMLPSGPAPALLVEADNGGEGGAAREEEDVLRANVEADLQHARDLIAEATGKPRVRGEGGGSSKNSGDERGKGGAGKPARTGRVQEGEVPFWRSRFAEMGIVESEDTALSVHGVEKVGG
jgi:hypothetical protein